VVKVVAEMPQNRNEVSCEQEDKEFSAQTQHAQINVHQEGSHKTSQSTDVICSDGSETEHTISSQFKKSKSQNDQRKQRATISSDLINVILKQAKEQTYIQKSALRILARYAPLVQMYHESEDKIPAHLKNQMQREMSKAYQELNVFRLYNGSYSLFPGRKSYPDLPVTVSIFQVLAKARSHSKYVNEYELRKTLLYIYSRQSDDGCYYVSRSRSRDWPLHLESPLQSTAFVTATLLEAGQAQPILRKAKKCIENNNNSEMVDSTKAMLAFIEAKDGDEYKARQLLKELEKKATTTRDGISWKSDAGREIAAYYSLAQQHLGQTEDVKKATLGLLRQDRSLDIPVSAYAMAKAWPHFRSTQDLRVSAKDSETMNLRSFESRTWEPKSDKVKITGSGCALIQMDEHSTSKDQSQDSFKVTISGTDQGYRSCDTRNALICIKDKSNNASEYSFPVMKVQVPSGYEVDETLLRMVSKLATQ